MATKYSDLIDLRQQKAAYSIIGEPDGAWKSFIANEQFINDVLKKVIASVRNNDADMHKSFWMNGTYGTGKSHAGAVIKHLLCDNIVDIQDYVNEEFADHKYDVLRSDIFSVRKDKRLFPIALYGLSGMSHQEDLSLLLQCSIINALAKAGISIAVKTDFQNYIDHIHKKTAFWEQLINDDKQLHSAAPDTNKLISLLQNNDMSIIEKIRSALRNGGFDIRIGNANITNWFFEVQNELANNTEFNGLFVIWDEFTEVMNSPIGLNLLVVLQEIDELIMNSENNSYFFYISHQSVFKNLNEQQQQKTKGRYHFMSYNMEPVSAFKIMSSKFKYVGNENDVHRIVSDFFSDKENLLDIYSKSSTDPIETKKDLQKLFPLHPATANLAAYFAREAGSSTRSVFEFIGQFDGIRTFLNDKEQFKQKNTITPDYLWDYVLDDLNDNVSKYGAVTERYNSRRLQVENQGPQYTVVFKSVLLINALNNLANNETVTPTIDNIRNMFIGTKIENNLDKILAYFDENSIIQRQPGDVYSIQFTALPPQEILDIKDSLINNNFKYTHQVISFGGVAKKEFDGLFKSLNRAFSYEIYSIDNNEYSLFSKIESGKKNAQNYETFLALMVAKDATELNELKQIADKACKESRFKNVTFIVFETYFGNDEYARFIEYQANATCAQKHNLADQQKTHTESSLGMIKEWYKKERISTFTYYLNGSNDVNAFNKICSTINYSIAPIIFNKGVESLDLIKAKKSTTYWAVVYASKVVDNILSFNSKSDIIASSVGAMQHVNCLLQDSVEENLEFKTNCDPNHPLKLIYDFIIRKFDNTNKNETFNLADVLYDLTKPPYGLYHTYANMAMVAFAMRKYINQIYDTLGHPRNQQHLANDVVALFKCWDEKKGHDKLEFRFESKESQKLFNQFVDVFNLKSLKGYNKISSLTDARWAITNEYSKNMQYPLWSLKYVDGINDEIKILRENIRKVCEAENMRDPKLLAETVAGIDKYRFELGNLLNATDFKTGFRNYLKSITQVAIKDEELDQAIAFIRQNMQDEIGTWHEPEVEKALLNWKLSITIKEKFAVTVFVDPIGSGTIYGTGTFEDGSTTNLAAVANSGYEFERWSDGDNNFSKSIVIKNDVSFTAFFKKIPAKKAPAINVKKKENVIAKVKALTDINKAKIILERIIEKGDDTIIDIINEL